MVFQKGNDIGKTGGRPPGRKNRLCKAIIDDLAADWAENGAAAIRIMRMERPNEYVRAMVSILPRELLLQSTMNELRDDQIDELIARMREQLVAESIEAKTPLLIEAQKEQEPNGKSHGT